MAKKPNISNVVQNATMVTTINNNFQNIQTAFENTVSRDGSIPNSMSGDLDMNNNDILNVGGLLVGGVDYLALAEGYKNDAAASATNASGYATAAQAAQAASEAAYDSFDDRYLGAKASAPSVDNDGDALITGALYYDTTLNGMYVYNGSSWEPTAAGGTVSSVAQTVPTGFTVSGSPITTSGTLAISYDTGYQGYTTAEAAKLSGIETGATADQSAAEILTEIKTVDGTGSGLDADLLDGQHGSYYLAASSGTATNISFVGTPVEDVYTLSGTSVSLEPDNGSVQIHTLTGNTTYTDGFSSGQAITLMIDDGTAYTVTWPTMTWVNNGGTAPTLATSGYTVVALWKVSTTLYGALVGDGS